MKQLFQSLLENRPASKLEGQESESQGPEKDGDKDEEETKNKTRSSKLGFKKVIEAYVSVKA
jgi:hypothetical protein